MRVPLSLDDGNFFQITNLIHKTLDKLSQDVDLAIDFSHNMLKNPNLTDYSSPLILIFNGILLLGISLLSFNKKNYQFQYVIYYLGGISLSYAIYNLGAYFANFSSFHDICNSMI